MKNKKCPNYGDARICRNCAFSEVRNHSKYMIRPGYYCTKHEDWVNKYKVCSSHEYMGEGDLADE